MFADAMISMIYSILLIIDVWSWMFVSLAVGVSYATGITSLLTSPAYTKSVDTVEDLLEAGKTNYNSMFCFVQLLTE